MLDKCAYKYLYSEMIFLLIRFLVCLLINKQRLDEINLSLEEKRHLSKGNASLLGYKTEPGAEKSHFSPLGSRKRVVGRLFSGQ